MTFRTGHPKALKAPSNSTSSSGPDSSLASPSLERISSLLDPCVRMLAAAVFAPALFQQIILGPAHTGRMGAEPQLQSQLQPQGFNIDEYWHWLAQLDRQPQPLHQWLAQAPSYKLGLCHERLWQYFLAHNGDTTLIAANLPIWQTVADKQQSKQ